MPDNLELSRTRAELQALGADFALITSGENVTYVSHYEVPVDFGPAAAQRYVPPMAFFDVNEWAAVWSSAISMRQAQNSTAPLTKYTSMNVSCWIAGIPA